MMTRKSVGRITCSLVVLFLVFDGVGKFFRPAPVVEAFARIGWPIGLAAEIGAVLLACTAVYAIPRTAVLGAVLLTGYLGGAVATQLRAGGPLFSHVLFPVYMGILLWAGLWLRGAGVRGLFVDNGRERSTR